MVKIRDGYSEEMIIDVMGYQLIARSVYDERFNEFSYTFSIKLLKVSKFHKYMPDMIVRLVGIVNPERVVKIKTKDFGLLDPYEFRFYMDSNEVAMESAKEIKRQIDLFVEYHDRVLLEKY